MRQPQGNFNFRNHGGWVATWAASPQIAEAPFVAPTQIDNQTVRNIVFSSVGGDLVRVRLTNTFGTQPLSDRRGIVRVPKGEDKTNPADFEVVSAPPLPSPVGEGVVTGA